MINITKNRYMVENTISETVTSYDDAYRLVAWLIGKRTDHMIVHVIKGCKSRLLMVDNDMVKFSRTLIEAMNAL
jgi:hypothetical protein